MISKLYYGPARGPRRDGILEFIRRPQAGRRGNSREAIWPTRFPTVMTSWPPPVYRYRGEFDVPLEFAFRWCTDYRPDDARRAGGRFDRRVLHRSRSEVLFEDLWWQRDGWRWRRTRVALRAPDAWHAESIGNYRDASIDYRPEPLGEARCRLEIVLRRRPRLGYGPQVPKSEFERELRTMWARFGRSMSRDYRVQRGRATALKRTSRSGRR